MDKVAPRPGPVPTGAETPAPPEASARYQRQRDRIVDAATVLINERGLKGLTFAAVAEAVGLNTTSVTYYFKRKEMLAAESIERTVDSVAELIAAASVQPDPRARVEAFLRGYLEQAALSRLGEARPLALLSDLRALGPDERTRLLEAYAARVLRPAARLFGPNDAPLNIARAHVLLDSCFWSRAWLMRYSVGDYERVGKRLMKLLENGILPDGSTWQVAAPAREPVGANGPDITPETFLRAATRLINERGYRGASVERIAGELNVSKGSFYHHLEGKDDLVLECFQRSYGRFSAAQRQAINGGGDFRERIAACLGDLLDIQLLSDFPLLRITALQALPTDLRRIVLARSDRMATRFAGMIADGMEEGSLRPTDPLIAAQWMTGLINSAHDLRPWAEALPDPSQAPAIYAHTIGHGLFAPL